MPFEVRSDRAQLQQVLAGKKPRFRPRGIEQGAACPFESTNRSFSGFCGSLGSYRISLKKSAATMSAADMQLVGWPLPASDVERTESMRSWAAILRSASIEAGKVTSRRKDHGI